MDWRVLKANADTEREHLNRILADIGTTIDAISVGATAWGSITGTLSDQTDLNSALNGKEDSFSKGDLVAGANISLTGTLTGRLVGAGNITIDATGGSDPWTYVKLGSDFSTTSTSTTVTGMEFSPTAGNTYEVEGLFLMTTTSATIGARPGVAWASGTIYGGAEITAPNSATASAIANLSNSSSTTAASTGLPNTTDTYLGTMKALFVMGTPGINNFRILFGTESAGTSVTMKAGSFFKYRTI